MNMSNMAIGADDKKKLIALGGLVAVVFLILIYLFFFRGDSSSTTTAQDTIPPPGERFPGGAGGPGAPMANTSAPAGGGGGGANVTAISLASLSGSRVDPFTPQYILPPPPPPPTVPLPQPEILPQPQGNYASLPPAFIVGNKPSTVLRGLPPILLPKLTHFPTSAQNFEAPKQSGGAALATPSSDKRLSGVIIGDSVHALLEVSSATGTQTYVVQPGDTIAGMRILDIRRVQVGGKTVPRMLISENGEEKYVDMRASFNPQTQQGAGGSGAPGLPGAFPGNPTIFPAPSVRPGQQVGRGANPFSVN